MSTDDKKTGLERVKAAVTEEATSGVSRLLRESGYSAAERAMKKQDVMNNGVHAMLARMKASNRRVSEEIERAERAASIVEKISSNPLRGVKDAIDRAEKSAALIEEISAGPYAKMMSAFESPTEKPRWDSIEMLMPQPVDRMTLEGPRPRAPWFSVNAIVRTTEPSPPPPLLCTAKHASAEYEAEQVGLFEEISREIEDAWTEWEADVMPTKQLVERVHNRRKEVAETTIPAFTKKLPFFNGVVVRLNELLIEWATRYKIEFSHSDGEVFFDEVFFRKLIATLRAPVTDPVGGAGSGGARKARPGHGRKGSKAEKPKWQQARDRMLVLHKAGKLPASLSATEAFLHSEGIKYNSIRTGAWNNSTLKRHFNLTDAKKAADPEIGNDALLDQLTPKDRIRMSRLPEAERLAIELEWKNGDKAKAVELVKTLLVDPDKAGMEHNFELKPERDFEMDEDKDDE